MHRVAPDDTLSHRLANKGRAPVPRFALVGNYRKLRYLGQIASDHRPHACVAAMSTPGVGRQGRDRSPVRLIGRAALT